MKLIVLIFVIFIFCSPVKTKQVYQYQCYKYYDGKSKIKLDSLYCKKCLCIDTSNVKLW